MAPLPPFLVRIATVYLTQILTRRLQQSPAFFRLVDRMLHEVDHFPHRLQGRPIPPYIGRDPHEPTLSEQAQEAWRRQVDDPGEPHDLPDPFGAARPPHTNQKAPFEAANHNHSTSSSSPHRDPLSQRQKTKPKHAGQQRSQQRAESEADKGMDEMRSLLEKIRNQKQ